jgi:hypothetical protein
VKGGETTSLEAFAIPNRTLVLVVPLAVLVFGFCISWLVVRSRGRARYLLEFGAFLPHALPEVILAVGASLLALFVLRRVLPLYGTVWLIAMVYLVARLPANAVWPAWRLTVYTNRLLGCGRAQPHDGFFQAMDQLIDAGDDDHPLPPEGIAGHPVSTGVGADDLAGHADGAGAAQIEIDDGGAAPRFVPSFLVVDRPYARAQVIKASLGRKRLLETDLGHGDGAARHDGGAVGNHPQHQLSGLVSRRAVHGDVSLRQLLSQPRRPVGDKRRRSDAT